jgi:hypothetical protein
MTDHPRRPRRHHRRAARTTRDEGIAVVAACEDCAHLIGNPEPSEHGIRMAVIHIGHVPELEALGWITTRQSGPHEPPDCCCLYYHLEHWEGGHGDDCCGLDGG